MPEDEQVPLQALSVYGSNRLPHRVELSLVKFGDTVLVIGIGPVGAHVRCQCCTPTVLLTCLVPSSLR